MLYTRFENKEPYEIKYISGTKKYDSYIPYKNHNGNLEIEPFSLRAKPLEFKEGYTLVANIPNKKWVRVVDYRGKKAYNTESKEEIEIDYIGELKEGYTFKEPLEYSFWDNEKKEWIVDTELKALKELEAKYLEIENYIYSYYPAKKQAQDDGWVKNFETKLKAVGVENLEKQIVDFVKSFFAGNSLDSLLNQINDDLKYMYEKLIKVGIKSEWMFLVIQEGKLAIAENREPNFPPYPLGDE